MDQKRVVIYIGRASPHCWRAKRLLRKGYAFEVVEVSSYNELPVPPARKTGRRERCHRSLSTGARWAASKS
jgi:glutaredoxin